MKLLAIDTSSNACSLAIQADEKLDLQHEILPMKQAQHILPMIDQALKRMNLVLSDLDAIAFGAGPGSFTGLRLACSVAQGLAFAMNLPLISISSMAALAQTGYLEFGFDQSLIAVDARMNEIYWGIYAADSAGFMQLQSHELVISPEKAPLPLGKDWYALGSAWEVYGETLVKHLGFTPKKIDFSNLAIAKGLMSLARAKYQQKAWTPLNEALPVYLRNKVAEKSKR